MVDILSSTSPPLPSAHKSDKFLSLCLVSVFFIILGELYMVIGMVCDPFLVLIISSFLGCADTVVEVLTCTVSISLIAFLSLHFLGFVSTPLSMSMGTYYCSSHLSCIFVSRFTCCVDIPAVYVLDLCIYLMNYLTI